MTTQTTTHFRNLSLALGVIAAITAGCAGGPSTDLPDEGIDPPAALDIAGHWKSACIPSPQADGSTNYFNLDFNIGVERWDLDYNVFGDDTCETGLVTVNIEGPYEIGEESSAVEGAHEARFGFATKTIEAHIQPLADVLNSLDPCGTEDFVVGAPQSVYATGCPAFGQYPEDACSADYDLVMRDGDTLVFGARPADNDMCIPEHRPTALSPVVLSLLE